MGDSLTEGVGDENKEGGYVGIIPKELEEEPNIPSVKRVITVYLETK